MNYKKIFNLIGLVLAIFMTGFYINLSAQPANTNIAAEQPKEAAKKSASEDILTAGQNVEIKSEGVKGDAAIAGENAKVSGSVNGYLMAAGANVNIDAPIGNDLWAAGANITVSNTIADNAMLAGSTVVLESNSIVGHDAKIAAGTVEIKGKITRNLNIAAGNVQIFSEVGGDAVVYAEKLTLNSGAVVNGNLIVNSPNEPIISPDAKVLGRIDFHKTENKNNTTSNTFGNWFGSWLITFLWITVLGLVAVWFSPVWTNRVAEMLKAETAKSLLTGLVVMILVPIVFVILLVTVIGLPLAFLLGAISFVVFLFSGVFISYFFGDWFLHKIKRWETSNVLKIVFGALIVTFVMALPWLGSMAKFAVMFFGVGAFLLERRDFFHKLREQGLV